MISLSSKITSEVEGKILNRQREAFLRQQVRRTGGTGLAFDLEGGSHTRGDFVFHRCNFKDYFRSMVLALLASGRADEGDSGGAWG